MAWHRRLRFAFDALLYEWDRAKFEDGAAIGLLDAPSKRRLLSGVARRVHEEHAAEISEQEVIQHFAETLPDLGRPPEDAKRIIAEIRDRSGLLVERRPGFFAFSHLTFQEYLCALDYVTAKRFGELVGHYEESWWHEVIILAAGTQLGGGGTISRLLLAENDDMAFALAARCLETEADMPVSVRKKIEKGLQQLIPPRSPADRERIKRLGIVAAPLLANFLQEAKAVAEITEALILLGELDYEPAVPAVARYASDHRPAETFIERYRLAVGGVSTIILLLKAERGSRAAQGALAEAFRRAPIADLEAILSAPKVGSSFKVSLGAALKTRRRESASRKSAEGTA